MLYQQVRWSLYRLVCGALIMVPPPVTLTGGVLANGAQFSRPAYVQPDGSVHAVEEMAPLAQDADPTTRTDNTGKYRFENLPRGTHKVTLDPTSLPRALRPTAGESAPTHQYFVPFDDRDLIALLRAANTCQGYQGRYPVGNILTSGVSLVGSWSGSAYYYDHWEDGYDPDPLRPGPTTETGALAMGSPRLFSNDIDTSTRPWGSRLYYDGRDRITVAGEEAAVIRYAYPSVADSVIGGRLAGALEIEETASWSTAFTIPAGEDQGARSDFAFTGGTVMALQDGTQVFLNGALVATLNMGRTFFVNGAGNGPAAGGLNSGDTFTATAPIMVNMFGSICDLTDAGEPWSGNGYTLEPLDHWDSDYWAPVPNRSMCDSADMDIFVYNPSSMEITIRVDDGSPVDVRVPARSSRSITTLLGRGLATDRGVHIYSPTGERFWGLVNIDTRDTAYEWGYSLMHDLGYEVVLGWSPGNSNVPPIRVSPPSGNLAWVTPVSGTVVLVDLNGDGISDRIDCNGDGDALDTGVDGFCNEPSSNSGVPVLRGQTLRVADPVDADLSGAFVYSRDRTKIAVVWGEDSCVARTGRPYLDLGYNVLPLTSHSLVITKTAEPSPVRAGGVLTYTLAWGVNGHSTAPTVTISDTVPANTSLITATLPVTVNGALLTWSLGDRLPGDSGAVTFTVRVDTSVVSGTLLRNTTVITASDGITHTDTITTLVQVAPRLELGKSVTPGEVVYGMPFTYTIRITNTGSITLSPLVLTDTLPPGIHYVGPAVPQLPDWVAQPLLHWTFPGPFIPGASMNVAFAVTATPGITGTLINTATVTGHHPTGVVTDTDTAPVVVHDPKIALDKQVAAYDRDDLVAPNYVTFTIAIANVGPSVIDVLPLQDQYDPYYLSFVSATPYPDEPADDGVLNWYDLTLPGNGFGRNLGLGQVFTVTTVFSIVHDITTTINMAEVTRAADVYRNPANRVWDSVPISNAPTAVELLYFRGEGAADRQVRLEWATALELDNVGFNVYRADADDWSQASLVHFEPAAVMGGRLGASYAYTDTAPSDGEWWYWLVDVDTRGAETHATRSAIRVEVNTALRYRAYLPLVVKSP